MNPQTLPPETGQAPEQLQRRKAIHALERVIYARGVTLPRGPEGVHPEHDPALRHRTEAVSLLGRFPDPEAVTVLRDLVLRGERVISPPAGRWLRDSALLALLNSTHLPQDRVNQALGRIYSVLRHPFPWQWSKVYDDLPLLARYRKINLFFRAFWLGPLLILAIPTLVLAGQMLFPQAGSFSIGTLPVVIGSGLEIYLMHQVIIALLAGRLGPLLRLPIQVTARWKGWIGAVFSMLALISLLIVVIAIVSGEFQYEGSAAVFGLGLAMLVLPLLLLPMFIVAHDLEQTLRYMSRGQEHGLRWWTIILRRGTDVAYLLFLPTVVALTWTMTSGDQPNLPVLAFLIYLFIVPFIVAGGLMGLTRLFTRTETAGSS